jgi:hypothetical protein
MPQDKPILSQRMFFFIVTASFTLMLVFRRPGSGSSLMSAQDR